MPAFLNFTTYTATGALVDTIFDGQIAPDAGSANPFAEPGPELAGDYTVTIGANPGSGNFLNGGGSRFAFVVYRIYLPDQGGDKTGGVGVPTVTLTDFSGNSRTLRPCPFADAETSLGNLILLLEAAGMRPGSSARSLRLRTSLRRVGVAQARRVRQPYPSAPRSPASTFFRTRRRPISRLPTSASGRTKSW